MVLSLRYLVPEEYDYWYFHEEAGILLVNDTEYGWCKAVSLDRVEQEVDELKEAIEKAREAGGIDGTELPIPENYEHTKYEPEWKQ